ncbi:hypothetical protein ABPG75_003570 [Micractinium tetrahymenae]
MEARPQLGMARACYGVLVHGRGKHCLLHACARHRRQHGTVATRARTSPKGSRRQAAATYLSHSARGFTSESKASMGTRVGIIGAGSVGSTLGRRLLASNRFAVKYGTRDPSSERVAALLASQPSAAADTIPAVVEWAEVVILATPSWEPSKAREQIQRLAGSLGGGIKGKVLIDVINGLSGWPALSLSWDGGPSTSEILQETLPNTAVFKAFSTVGVEQLGAPDGSLINGQQLTMLLAGGPPDRRHEAEAVVAGVGFAPKYVGPIRYTRNLDAIAELWIHLSIPGAGETPEAWGRNFHFQVIEKAST